MPIKKETARTSPVKAPSQKNAIKKTVAKKVAPKKMASKVGTKVGNTAGNKTVNKAEGDGLPLSVVIRRRIEAQNARFHANDNISAFIRPGEFEGLVDEVAQKMEAVLESLVIDTESDHNTKNTSRRVAKMYVQEVFNGRYTEQPVLTKFPNVSRLNELMIIGPITVRSACSHHLCPIMGRIWIGVLPHRSPLKAFAQISFNRSIFWTIPGMP